MDDDKLCGFLIKALQSADIEQLMYPPTATQPSRFYKDSPLHEPFLCNRIVFFFESLIKCGPGHPCHSVHFCNLLQSWLDRWRHHDGLVLCMFGARA